LRTEKTGTPVHAPLPPFVVEALNSFPHGDFFFWTGVGDLAGAKRSWDRRLKCVFAAAGISDGHAHRLRDTFAVALLEKGVPIQVVAMLLGNTVTIVEKHYAPWVASRQIALEAAVRQTWA
jgi:site-specific recombinase XerD